MKFTLKNILKVLIIPLIFGLIYGSLFVAQYYFKLPSDEELIVIIIDFIDQYGLIIVFFAALLEGTLLIGNYFPGGFVIFLGVISAIGDIPRAITVVSVVCVSFFIAYLFNYYLGRYGWYKLLVKFGMRSSLDSMTNKLSKHVFTAIISSYWFPNLAALCSTAAGIMKVPLRKFLIQSTFVLIIWNIFWGFFVYKTGDALLRLDLTQALLIFAVWCSLILVKVFVFDERIGKTQKPTIAQ